MRKIKPDMANGKKLYFILFSLFVVVNFSAFPQSYNWDAGFHGFFDNREYFNNFDKGQTMFGSRVFAHGGFSINDKNDINIGLNYLYEFGSKGNFITPDLVMYYSYKNTILFNLGVFPRKDIVKQPLFLLTDTLNYYRPYIEGMFIEFRRPLFYHNIWLDWTGRQSNTRKESLLIGASGRFQKNIFFYEHHISFFHYALPENAKGYQHIQDNGGLISMAGIDLSKSIFLDTLLISSGLAFSYDRLRSVYDTRIRLGWYSEFNTLYKGFGLSGNLYWGDGHVLLNGDQLYKSKFYQRYNIYYLSQKISTIRARIQFSVHLMPGNIDYSQLLSVFVNFNGSKKIKSD